MGIKSRCQNKEDKGKKQVEERVLEGKREREKRKEKREKRGQTTGSLFPATKNGVAVYIPKEQLSRELYSTRREREIPVKPFNVVEFSLVAIFRILRTRASRRII